MLVYFAALTVAAIVLLLGNPRNAGNRWAAIFLACAAIGGLPDWLRDTGAVRTADVLALLNLCLTPYAVLVFCLVYADFPVVGRHMRTLKAALLLPALVTFAITPLEPVMTINYGLLLAWSAPYYLGSCAALIVSLWKENNPGIRRSRAVTTLIMVPTLLAALVFINVAKLLDPDTAFFSYISVFLVYSFVVALLCVFVYGVLGVRLRVERDPLANAMSAVSTGARLLNHTLKNEIGKIALSAENLTRALPPEDALSRQQLQIIAASSDHMLEMVGRIHNRMKDIVLSPRPCRLDEIVGDSVALNRPRLAESGIAVETDFAARPTLLCDPVHLKETIGNLLANAAEAMPGGGTITIGISERGQNVSLSVEDNGTGIAPEALPHLFEPFYSTKNHGGNFGLGLSYVYNVMRKSGGSVDVSSRPGKGTRVCLHFPKNARVRN